jgi:hypothetical protein
MISATEAQSLMPSNRKDTILGELEDLITTAAESDKTSIILPKGFFGHGVETDVLYNAKYPPLYVFVVKKLESLGFRFIKNATDLNFTISWDSTPR